MSDFILITSRYQFSNEAKKAWSDHLPGPMKGLINIPHVMPCLAAMFISNGAISTVVLDKSSAKRLIYPKTNKNRAGVRWFDWVDGDLDEEIDAYVNAALERNHLNGKNPVQAAYINELMHKVKGEKGPVLMANRSYNFEDVMVVNFFLVTKELASSLVYYHKNDKNAKDAAVDELLEHDQVQPGISDLAPASWPARIAEPVEVPNARRKKRPEDFPFLIKINREGKISVATCNVFEIQTNIPRFSNNRESALQLWEVAAIRDINTGLENTQVDVEGTLSIAKIKCKEFLAERRKLRISCAILHGVTWMNRSRTDPKIRAIIQQHSQ
jgi:hypothetical protein